MSPLESEGPAEEIIQSSEKEECPNTSSPPVSPAISEPAQLVAIDLAKALDLAGVENPTIALAREAVSLALAQQQEARALLLPNLNAGTSYDHHDGNLQTASGELIEVNRQSLYIGAGAGAIGAGTVLVPGVQIYSPLADGIFAPRAAHQVVITRQFDAAATNNSVLLDVGVGYFRLVGAEGRLAAILQSELDFAEVARLTAAQAKTQQGLQSDADRAQSEVLLLRQDEQRAKEEVAVSSARLAQLLNLDPSTGLQTREGPMQLLELVDPEQSLESLIQTALDNRPEVQARTAAIAASQVRYRQERIRPFLPTLFIGYSAGGFGGGSNLTDTTFGHFNSRTDVSAYAFWSLQNLGLGNLELQRRRRAEVREAEAELVSMIDQIRDEVAEARANTLARRQELGVARKKAERALDGAQRDLQRVRALVGRPIEVLDSARLLATARQEFVTALAQYNQAQLQLFVSLGQPLSRVSPSFAKQDCSPDSK